MPAATSNIVSVSLLSTIAVESLQSTGALVSAALAATLPPTGTAVETLQSTGAVVSGTFDAVDPFFDEVSLLLTCDGSNGSTVFPDSSSFANVMTQRGTPPVSVDTSDPMFGSGAANFTTGTIEIDNALQTPITPDGPLDLDYTKTDFTIEGWFKLAVGAAISGSLMSDNASDATNPRWQIGIFGGGTGVKFVYGSASPGGPTVFLVPGTWYAFAVVCFEHVVTVYVNGVGGTPETLTSPPVATSGNLNIGTDFLHESLAGEMDEIRISTIARYLSNYTPATAPFPTS